MATLPTTSRLTPKRHTRLNVALTTLAVLVAIAVAAFTLTVSGTRTTHPAPSLGDPNDASAAYAPPHYYSGKTGPTSPPSSPGWVTPNNQESSAYTKGALYNVAR
jgi:hypothetical protein